MTNKKKTIPAHYSWNSSIFTRGVVDPIKRKLGYVDENEHPVSLKESATGQELDRMNDTAKKATTIAMAGLGVSSIPALARYAVSLPQIAIPEIAAGLGTGIAGAKVGEKVGQALGGDGYWGSLIGGLGVGAAGVKAVDALAPIKLERVKLATKTIFGDTSPEYSGAKDLKWKWYTKGDHYDNAVKTRLFSPTSSVAHEVGHGVSKSLTSDPHTLMGAYTPGYQYSAKASPEVNVAENYADWFRTKIGFPYKGNDSWLTFRQSTIDNNPTIFMESSAPDERLYEIYGYRPDSESWVPITKRAADLQEGNTAKYSMFKAVGSKERLPSKIASRKANLVERGFTETGEPYVIRKNELSNPSSKLTLPEHYSGPADWALSGSGSWKVKGHKFGGILKRK